jgi:hypothetical protein
VRVASHQIEVISTHRKIGHFASITCEVTFDETQPHSQLVFECAGDDELCKDIFQEEEHENGDDEYGGVVPLVEHVPTTLTTVMDGPSPTPTTTNQDQGEATIEEEAASRLELPRQYKWITQLQESSAT